MTTATDRSARLKGRGNVPGEPLEDDGDGRKLTVTLGTEAAAATRRMAEAENVSAPEIVRRGLSLLGLLYGLDPSEELVIRDRQSGDVERLRLLWGW